MMASELQILGFDSLLETCRRLNIPIEILPPATTPLGRDELPGARLLDPFLVALYGRMGGLMIGGSTGAMQLCRRDNEVNYLARFNAERVRRLEGPFSSVVAFAEEPATLYCFALVPWLVDSLGFQPVILIDPYEVIYALPIASNLDRFLQTYARCLEYVVDNPWMSVTDIPEVNFWSLPEVLAADERLVEMLRGGIFDELMKRGDETERWVEAIKTAAERT
jgi:hypothetical protein